MKTATLSTHEAVTETIVSLLNQVANGDIETWIPLSGLARNPYSNHTYTSVNQLLLSHTLYRRNYSMNLWLTFKQIQQVGGRVKKGEEATPIVFTELLYFYNGEKITKDEAKAIFSNARNLDPTIAYYKEAGILTKRFLKYYMVFNIAQTTGLPDKLMVLPETDDRLRPLPAVRHLIAKHAVNVVHVVADEAFYDPAHDKIQMPFMQQFGSAEHYAAVLLHECIHWTGHPARLNRVLGAPRTQEYAFEELIAELGSTFLCAELGIPASLTSSAAYIKSWLTLLQNDSTYIFKAMALADKAVSYMLEQNPEYSFTNH